MHEQGRTEEGIHEYQGTPRELKATREDYLEEINALVGKIDDLEK